jgi:guanine deaminase
MQPPAASESSPALGRRQFSLATLLHLATLGGAQVCGLEDRVGTFAPGKAFDALLVSVRSNAGNPALWGVDLDQALQVEHAEDAQLEMWLERFLFTGDDRNIRRVYVQGRWIGGAELAPRGLQRN